MLTISTRVPPKRKGTPAGREENGQEDEEVCG